MALITTLAACNTNPALNGPDGTTDLPSTLDDAIRLALSFIAQLRDGAGIPTGMVSAFAGSIAPIGWIRMNGALISRTTYPNLFAFATAQGLVSEATWNANMQGCFSVGDGSTTFRLPDTRGTMIRDLDESRGIDASRLLGSYQVDRNAAHTHSVSDPTHTHGVSDPTHTHSMDAQGNHQHSVDQFASVFAGNIFAGAVPLYSPGASATGVAGLHAHNIFGAATGISLFGAATGISVVSSGGDGVPKNYAFPHFIKY
ncbi:tail fiber protein [Variovorax sp. PBL-E5]|uniref:tail fiber protein n=1 Tax=Variovorax sp. PBL-E5 TaxID=434014 RepID=UPI001315DF59|nr:tail fiber protein [Variovorax sp. PBL-E5]VTU36991.1 Phage Tail Collar Domain protein [Variovorax sp. PBL-E5]